MAVVLSDHSPPFSRRGGCAINRSRSNKIKCASRLLLRWLRDLLLTTPPSRS